VGKRQRSAAAMAFDRQQLTDIDVIIPFWNFTATKIVVATLGNYSLTRAQL